MARPLGFYTSYTPGEDSLLETLQEKYGSYFEQMGKREKLHLLQTLASNIARGLEGDVRGEIYDIGKEIIERLPIHDQSGLMEALASNERCDINSLTEGFSHKCWCGKSSDERN